MSWFNKNKPVPGTLVPTFDREHLRTMYRKHERFVESAVHALQTPGINAALEGQRDDFIGYLENSFVPNVSEDGTVDIPRTYKATETLAMLFIEGGSSFTLGESFSDLTDQQVLTAAENGIKSDSIKPYKAKSHKVAPLNVHKAGLTAQYFHATPVPGVFGIGGQRYDLLGRPLLYVCYDPQQSESTNPMVVSHELGHFEQFLYRKPVRHNVLERTKRQAGWELERYQSDSKVGRVYSEAGIVAEDEPLLTGSLLMEAIRQIGTEPDKPYELTSAGNKIVHVLGLDAAMPLVLNKKDRAEAGKLNSQFMAHERSKWETYDVNQRIRVMTQYFLAMSDQASDIPRMPDL